MLQRFQTVDDDDVFNVLVYHFLDHVNSKFVFHRGVDQLLWIWYMAAQWCDSLCNVMTTV